MIHGYVRVSTADQAKDEKTSLADQERRIRAVATLHGSENPPIWRDEGVSGSVPLHERPAGHRMLAQIKRGDVIVASKLDRLFRSGRDALYQSDDLKKAGIDIILIDVGTEPILNSSCGKLYFHMLAGFAEFPLRRRESTSSSSTSGPSRSSTPPAGSCTSTCSRFAEFERERIGEGKAGKRARGGFAGGNAPFGWRVEGEGKGALLVEDPTEQGALAKAREMKAAGMGFTAIARALTEQGHLSREKTPLTAAQVLRWLK